MIKANKSKERLLRLIIGITFYLFLQPPFIYAQDVLDKGDLEIEEFKADFNKRFSFGTIYQKMENEDAETFVKRVLAGYSNVHHGAFELTNFKNSIVSFASYKFQKIPIIIGLLFEPLTSKGEYRLLKTIELTSGCGNIVEIKSVFLHDANPNSLGKELIIQGLDYCGIHGTKNYVYIYNGQIEKNKLTLTSYLLEHCDYSEVKINGEWDYDMGYKNVEDRRYNKCNYTNVKEIRKAINNLYKK
jgi:hypothetical protein